MVFWPYHCVEEDETKRLVKMALKSDVGHGRTLHHSPARRLPTSANAPHGCHVSSSPGWVDPTRIPVDPTHYEQYHDEQYTWWTIDVQRMASAWCNDDVIMQLTSQYTCQHSGTHLPCHWSRAASRGKWFCAAESTCNRIWDWIWAVDQARIVMIKS